MKAITFKDNFLLFSTFLSFKKNENLWSAFLINGIQIYFTEVFIEGNKLHSKRNFIGKEEN